ncbi:MAG: hypothetical protein GY927_09745 [bacterium]|nr:hypothetical protein [bacterium]
MSSGGARNTGIKQLKKLLRAMSREGAHLLQESKQCGSTPCYRVVVLLRASSSSVLVPDKDLVEQVMRRGLLTRTKTGWVIGNNGRLALKRLLAGTDPFAEQHQSRTISQRNIDGDERTVVVNDRSSPLGWLRRRKDVLGEPMISKMQFAAGERLAQDFQFAGMMPRMTSSWSEPGTGGQRRSAPGAWIEISDNRLAARQRVRGAIDEVGSDLSDILLDVCCFQLGLSDAEKAHGWPRRSGKLILQIALDRLVAHYGMGKDVQRIRRRSSISHWGGDGYKPS